MGSSHVSGHSGQQCRELPSRLRPWSPRDATLCRVDLLWPKRFLWAMLFFHYPLYQCSGAPSSSRNIQHCSMRIIKLVILIVNLKND